MPSLEDRRLLTRAFYEDCIWPGGDPVLEDAWLGIYQLLLWYEHGYIHIREANDLHKSRVWQERATKAEAYIARRLHIEPDELPLHVDRMMRLPRWQKAPAKGVIVTCPECGHAFSPAREMQRNNPLGNGLRILTAEILNKWGDRRFTYEEEVSAWNWFPGIQMPGRSTKPKIDVMARTEDKVRVIISCKWSGRHDRMSDVTNECQEYKGAAVKRQNMTLQHFVITNEVDGQRTDKILNQPCIDGLIMVHLPLAQELGNVTPMMERAIQGRRLLDLTDFVRLTRLWTV